MGLAYAHAQVAAQEGSGKAAGAALVSGDLIGGAGVDVAAGQGANERQLGELGGEAKLLGIAVEAVGEEENGLVGLVAQCELGEAGGRLAARLGVAGEPVGLGLEVAGEQGEGDGVSQVALSGEGGGGAEADEGGITEQAGDARENLTRLILMGSDEDAETGGADPKAVERLVSGLQASLAPVQGLCSSDSGLKRHGR